jgi:hypothetical protein
MDKELHDRENFIDVFYFPDVDPDTPYRCFIWEAGTITGDAQHASIEAAVAWCRKQTLTIRVYDNDVRARFRMHGIDAQPPITREKQVGQ